MVRQLAPAAFLWCYIFIPLDAYASESRLNALDRAFQKSSGISFGSKETQRQLLLEELSDLMSGGKEDFPFQWTDEDLVALHRKSQNARVRSLVQDLLFLTESVGEDFPTYRDRYSEFRRALANHLQDPSAASIKAVKEGFHQTCRYAPDGGRQIRNEFRQQFLGPNVRLTISESGINKLISTPSYRVGSVETTIIGQPTKGTKRTLTQSLVELRPNQAGPEFCLVASGTLHLCAYTDGDLADYRTRSSYVFSVRQNILVSSDTQSAAEVALQRLGETSEPVTMLSSVPILGTVYGQMAMGATSFRKDDIDREQSTKIKAAIIREVTTELDSSKEAMLKLWDGYLHSPLGRPGDVFSAHTTATHLKVQGRVADNGNLAAPDIDEAEYPSKSPFQVMVHESFYTNEFSRILGERQVSLSGIAEDLGVTLPGASIGLAFSFSRLYPVVVKIDSGRIHLRAAGRISTLAAETTEEVVTEISCTKTDDGKALQCDQVATHHSDEESIAARFMISAYQAMLKKTLLESVSQQQGTLRPLVIEDISLENGWMVVEADKASEVKTGNQRHP